MTNPDLNKYIESLRSKGLSDEKIKDSLKNAGWTDELINQGFIQEADSVIPPPPPPPGKSSPQQAQGSATLWDAFEHTLMFISLYFMATSVSFIAHSLVNYYFPNISQREVFGGFIASLVLIAQATVIVSTPLFAFFHLDLTKRTQKNQELRKLKARRVLTYITLVGTFLIMLSSLIGTVYALLSGNLNLNFVLNLIITLVISGTIFAYYLTLVKQDQKAYV